MTLIEKLRRKFNAVRSALSERGLRLWAGAEADAIGRGGVAWVAEATGLAISTVRIGRDEVRSGETPTVVRDRRPGAGRPPLEKKDPGLVPMLESLVNPATRGDPESPLRWTSKSLSVLARELTNAKHPVGADKVGELLRAAGYSLQANSKTKEGVAHPDRNAQFELINGKAQDFLERGLPVISVDAKKKEFVAEHANNGREWEPKGKPVKVISHDFFVGDDVPHATPYGIYDVGKDVGFVNVGTDNNTPTFAARSVEKWWDQMGCKLYPSARELFVTADSGGSNAARSHLWKVKLQQLADRTRLTVHVSHFPPGTSKWNKIEHRLFSFISINWRGRPLADYETIVSLIAGTKTSKGLTVSAELDTDKYPLRLRATEHTKQSLALERNAFHGEWNYSLRPRTKREQKAAAAEPPTRVIITHAEKRATWMKLIGEQMKSGLNGRDFCSQRGLNYPNYAGARLRLIGKIRKSGRAAE
jgi:Rhodopirellula transposase DDE domain